MLAAPAPSLQEPTTPSKQLSVFSLALSSTSPWSLQHVGIGRSGPHQVHRDPPCDVMTILSLMVFWHVQCSDLLHMYVDVASHPVPKQAQLSESESDSSLMSTIGEFYSPG